MISNFYTVHHVAKTYKIICFGYYFLRGLPSVFVISIRVSHWHRAVEGRNNGRYQEDTTETFQRQR